MKRKQNQLLLTALIFLTSCSAAKVSDCYQCYLGNMLISQSTFAYDKIQNQEILSRVLETESIYYANVYTLSDEDSKKAFFNADGITVSSDDRATLNHQQDDSIFVYFFAQIPQGYKAYKRNNTQGYVLENEKILLTDNFYYYANRNDLFYCQIDIENDESIKENYVFCFYFEIPSVFSQNISNDNIRVLYHLNESEEEIQS